MPKENIKSQINQKLNYKYIYIFIIMHNLKKYFILKVGFLKVIITLKYAALSYVEGQMPIWIFVTFLFF